MWLQGSCCQDGYHCCPMGYHCDPTYRYCLKQGLRYPFTARKQPSVIPAALIVAPEERSGFLEVKTYIIIVSFDVVYKVMDDFPLKRLSN